LGWLLPHRDMLFVNLIILLCPVVISLLWHHENKWNKKKNEKQLQWPAIFNPFQARSAFHLSDWKPLTSKLLNLFYCMSAERIGLFYINFPLVSVSQHYTNFVSISLCLRSDITSRLTNQLPRWPYKTRHSFSHFILATILEKC